MTGPHSTDLTAALLVERRYFRRRPGHAGHWELGIGLSHLSNGVAEQGTRTNFVEHAGAGVQWPMGDDASWGLGLRFQHISNAGREDPNIGLNVLAVSYTLYR